MALARHAARGNHRSLSRLRLLVVDDDVDTVEVLGSVLAQRGHHVRTACTMREALQLATAETFDVVVSDLGLPDGSGNELMRALRATSSIRGIAMSGWGRAEDLAASREAGFSEHLVKPVLLARLEEALARCCADPGVS